MRISVSYFKGDENMKRISSIILAIVVAVAMLGTDVSAAVASPLDAGMAKAALKTAATKKKTEAKKKETEKKEAKKDAKKKKKKKKVKLPKLAKPKKLKAYAGHNSVKLTWKAVPKAKEYIILRSVAGKKKFKRVGKTKKTEFVDNISYIYTDYAYRVVATMKYKKKTIKSPPAKIRKNSVRRLRVYVTFKSNRKYNTGTIHRGTRIRTDGYGGGYYLFDHHGKRHSVPRVAVRDAHAKYKKEGNYKDSEAELFISGYLKSHRLRPDKKYVIWVSTYTQHLYVFKKKKGKWKVTKDWEVSTGKAASPTSTGTKRIRRKVFRHHQIQFWNCFSNWNALHGVTGNMEASIGRNASNGCVRNSNGDAAWLYAKCAKGTLVVIY